MYLIELVIPSDMGEVRYRPEWLRRDRRVKGTVRCFVLFIIPEDMYNEFYCQNFLADLFEQTTRGKRLSDAKLDEYVKTFVSSRLMYVSFFSIC